LYKSTLGLTLGGSPGILEAMNWLAYPCPRRCEGSYWTVISQAMLAALGLWLAGDPPAVFERVLVGAGRADGNLA
jgi:hypothetical protein